MKDKILLIEDDKSIQRFLRISLETKDYKVISAETGIEGISLYMTDNPDLILLEDVYKRQAIPCKSLHYQKTGLLITVT